MGFLLLGADVEGTTADHMAAWNAGRERPGTHLLGSRLGPSDSAAWAHEGTSTPVTLRDPHGRMGRRLGDAMAPSTDLQTPPGADRAPPVMLRPGPGIVKGCLSRADRERSRGRGRSGEAGEPSARRQVVTAAESGGGPEPVRGGRGWRARRGDAASLAVQGAPRHLSPDLADPVQFMLITGWRSRSEELPLRHGQLRLVTPGG